MLLFDDFEDFSEKKVMIGLSCGINSAAVLIWVCNLPDDCKPKELHLFYSHFKEYSPDTLQFCLDLWSYAQKHCPSVIYKQIDNSIIDYFRGENMIPHPMLSPCTRKLKIHPMNEYKREHGIEIDMIGYVRDEARRYIRMKGKDPNFDEKRFPILGWNNEWCFAYVKNAIGWYPEIYDIVEKGKRVFKHNNCLPCKNMNTKDFRLVEKYYPKYASEAQKLAEELGTYWGRDESVTVGCSFCEFD
jgi:3'-phosphoadenosine 5'-phosphosulfate sulfotransferase (PAPS reductase)/FAD synthetase